MRSALELSLEGRQMWLLRSSPLDLRALLWSKYWVGTAPLLVLALVITVVTNVLLKASPFMMVVGTGTIILLTITISAMALGFGAIRSCCFAGGACADLPIISCLLGGGTPGGPDSACEDGGCSGPPTGACCFLNGTCADLTEMVCVMEGGFPHGHGTSCADNGCPGDAGAD